ncbi:hypothetical protein SHIRM173S_06513 [Streptomyces hirsutus]
MAIHTALPLPAGEFVDMAFSPRSAMPVRAIDSWTTRSSSVDH